MSLDVEAVDPDDAGRWNRLVERSEHTNLLHRAGLLRLQAEHSGTEPHLLVGLKGEEPVGLFPVFERTKGPITAAFSPPPPLWIHRLGPAWLNLEKRKQRKRERLKHQFVEGSLEWLLEHCGARYLQVRTEDGYRDARPFKWNDGRVTPEYTYVVDLTRGEEDLLASFSSDARRNVRNAEGDYAVEDGDADDVERILEQVHERFRDQDRSFELPTAFARALYERAPDGRVRPYVFTRRGEYVTGILTFEDERRIHRWQGGVKTGVDLPANDLLDWHVMVDAMERGIEEYDLVGAGDRRINSYKAKFSPALRPFYSVECGPLPVRAMVALYRRVR